MVKTRSQLDTAEEEERRAEAERLATNLNQPPVVADSPLSPPDVFVEPALPPPRTREPEATAAPAALVRREQGRGQTVTFAQERRTSPAASRCSSSAALRARQAEREAEQKLLLLKQKELEIERMLIQSRLAAHLDTIEAEGSQRGSVGIPERTEDINQWLDASNRTATTSAFTEAQTNEPLSLTSRPERRPQALPHEPPPLMSRPERGLQTSMPEPQPQTSRLERQPLTSRYDPEPLTSRYELATPQRDPGARDRTPSRERAPQNKSIDRLADVFEQMMQNRRSSRYIYDLPSFSGAPGEWLPFQAAYRDSTRTNQLTEAENLARLRSTLKGAARESVAALLHTATHPDRIMLTLEQCFGRPEVLIDGALADLKKLPRLGSTAADLNNFAIKLQNIVCILSTVDKKGYLNNPLLTRDVLERLSPHLRSRWCDYAYESVTLEADIVKLTRFLMKEADRALRYNYTASTTSQAATAQQSGRELRTTNPNQSGAKKKNPVYALETEDPCLCCGGSHDTPRCQKLGAMDVAERWEWARSNRVCFKCMARKHRREHCRAKGCGVVGCPHSHHQLLHAEAPPAQAPYSAQAPQPAPRRGRSPRRVRSPRAAQASPAEPAPPVAQRSRAAQAPPTAPAPRVSQWTRTARSPRAAQAPPEPEDCDRAESVGTTVDVAAAATVLLKIVPVTVSGPTGASRTFALLDEGSTISLIDGDLATEIGATGPEAPLCLKGVGNMKNQQRSRRVEVTVCGRGGERSHRLRFRTAGGLDLHRQQVSVALTRRHEHLAGLEEACYSAATPRLLIGADNWHVMVARETRTGRANEPAAVLTDLGWVIFGTAPREIRTSNFETALHLTTSHDEKIEELLKFHFSVDSLGVTLKDKVRPQDQRATTIFNNTVRRVGTPRLHYEVGQLWRDDEPKLPPNYQMALNRLRNIERKMDRDPAFAAEYAAQVENLIAKGYAEQVEETSTSSKQWFLPHFAVKNPNKPGKIRLVFDAAATCQGVSLNDALLEGPDLLQSLPGILFRFREGAYAVTADVQEMFLQIKIRAADQQSQLFLWRGEDRARPPKIYRMTSMIFGAASSPFLAHSVRNKTAADNADELPDAVEDMTRNHYMDDLVASYVTEEEAARRVKQVAVAHERGGFTLRGWISNSRRVIQQTPPELRATGPAQLGGKLPKVLGMYWSPEEDNLGFNTNMIRVPAEVKNTQRGPTKREALSAVMSIYDPLGLLSQYVITAKIQLQRLWALKLGWDEPLPEEECSEFAQWLSALRSVAALRIPRHYFVAGGGAAGVELHIFVDASESAYAAAAYWRSGGPEPAVCLIAAKAKVAPKKQMTIPRLELQAAVIGARLGQCILSEHRVQPRRTIYWSDSRTVLHWVRDNARRYSPFVAHRLGEIAETTEPNQWRWVPTAENPADDATRGNSSRNIAPSDRWYTGPAFLRRPEEDWPRELPVPAEPETCAHTVLKNTGAHLPDLNRFSKYERLLRATAYVLLFADKCRKRATELTLRHLERAEQLLLKKTQEDDFAEERRLLEHGGRLTKKSKLYELDPVLEDGLLKMRGRINAAPVQQVKRPPILNGRHPVVKMIILQKHCAAGHSSNERVVNDLRQEYWIIRLRPTVRAVAHACRTCQLRRARPQVPAMGDLPLARIEPYCRPFTNCGVDYFGPLTVTIGRRHEKRWVALFTCLTTRAIHLELVASLTTDSAIMALRRMAARRGWPRLLYSDNGTNFRGADVELRAAYSEWLPALRDYALQRRTEWRFIPPGAPNQGGAWERLVRSVKVALTATLATKAPKEEVLATLLAEAENTVNARPLTHVSVDPRDEEAITPSHFLLGGSTRAPLTGPCEEADRRTWRASQALADHFWARWVREYLPTLAPRRSHSGGERPLQVGDLVVVVDASLPRNVWPRGIVERTYPGPDGAVRSADIRTRGGVFRRPTTKLAVIPSLQEAEDVSAGGRTVTDGERP